MAVGERELRAVERRVNKDSFYFLPLGGTGEIGMNLNLYHHGGRWLIVDCGVMFGRTDHTQFALYPDVSFLKDKVDKIDGLVITHAHQDHLGAVRDLWPKLRCPVYVTRFAQEMLRDPLREVGLHGQVPLRVIPQSGRFQVGTFDLQRIPMTHSTVEMGGLVIRTPAGSVYHTGDFKIDKEPLVGRVTDEAALRALADESLIACISDSTNAHTRGWTPSEAEVAESLETVFAGCENRIAVALFSSNIARVRTLMLAAQRLEREVVMVGRSLVRTVKAARAAGYLDDLPEPLDTREFGFLPKDNVMLLCTGSQGEPRAALSRLADNSRRDLYLEAGDTVVFSSRKIPGNEMFLERIYRLLDERGIDVITEENAFVHVSGHPCQAELRALYQWIDPDYVVPVHGTPMHLEAHADLAESLGRRSFRIRNGHILRLGPGTPGVVGSVRTGRIRREEQGRRRR